MEKRRRVRMTNDERWIHLTVNKEATKANPTSRWLSTS
jgi:hypothetical protein